MTPELVDNWWEGVTDTAEATDELLLSVSDHGLAYWTGVGVVIIGGIAALRWGYNKITGKTNSLQTAQLETRAKMQSALA